MRRAEISDDGATWTIPGERTKNKRAARRATAAAGARDPSCRSGGTDLVFTTTGTHAGQSAGGRSKRRLDARDGGRAALAPARPAADRRHRHGRDRRRAPHRRGRAEPHQRGARLVSPGRTTARPTRQRRRLRWSAGPRTSSGWSPASRPRSSFRFAGGSGRDREVQDRLRATRSRSSRSSSATSPKMDWNEGDPPPPWKPDRDKRYRQKMTDWVNWHLDHAPTPRLHAQHAGRGEAAMASG